jgi:hypothetical protein
MRGAWRALRAAILACIRTMTVHQELLAHGPVGRQWAQPCIPPRPTVRVPRGWGAAAPATSRKQHWAAASAGAVGMYGMSGMHSRALSRSHSQTWMWNFRCCRGADVRWFVRVCHAAAYRRSGNIQGGNAACAADQAQELPPFVKRRLARGAEWRPRRPSCERPRVGVPAAQPQCRPVPPTVRAFSFSHAHVACRKPFAARADGCHEARAGYSESCLIHMKSYDCEMDAQCSLCSEQ